MNPLAASLQLSVDAFLRYLKVERQLSPLTQLSYAHQLQALKLLAQSIGVSEWMPLDTAAVLMLTVRSKRASLQSASLALRLASLRSFLDWLVSRGMLNANPVKGIRTPRSDRHLPKNIDIDLNDPLVVRDRAMLETMYGAGLRLSELVGLDCRHIDLAAGEIWVTGGKGSKKHKLPLGRTAVTWLQHWLAIRELFEPEDDAIFLSNQGRRISPRNVQKRFAEWGVKQGVNSYIHPHKLRHSPLVFHPYVGSSGDLRAVQELLGQANLTTTQIYTHLDFQHLAKVYDASKGVRCRASRCQTGEILMHFYRPLRPLAALTFDLDDTLYDNRPVIRQTEQQSMAFLQNYHPRLSRFQSTDLHRLRQELCEQEPEIYHDATQWRWRAIHLALSREGLSNIEATIGADAAMQNFALWRSRIEVPAATHAILRALGERYPLVAITNGNVDPALCGLGGYFQFVLRAGPDGRAKPYQDMYQLASERLGVAARQILHVGDDLTTDIAGALRAGFQACWINEHQRDLMQSAESRLLPHIEISRLASLAALL